MFDIYHYDKGNVLLFKNIKLIWNIVPGLTLTQNYYVNFSTFVTCSFIAYLFASFQTVVHYGSAQWKS